MNLKSMKRKDLQALCKEHGLPANASNSQMIDSLSSILQEKMKPKGCLKGSGGSSAEDLGIIRGGSKKVSFVLQDEEEDVDEESTMNPVGKSKMKSIRRRSSIAPEIDKGRDEIDKGSHYGSRKNVEEVPRRATRSRGLAESVLWSPVIEKKRNETEGVRQNAKLSMVKEEKASISEVPSTRSLRNRAVVVGGDKELVTDKNTRNTQKRKNSDKNELKEKEADLFEEDDVVGKKNLRKRSREGDSVEDEPPPRRPTRSHAKLEETVATEEVDVGRSKKRRRGCMEVLPVEKVVGKEIEMVLKPGGSTKRSRGNTLDSDAMESGVVTEPTRRSTRSSSGLLEAEKFVFAVGKSDQEGKAVRKNKPGKQANGGDSVSLLADSEVVAEPVRRSTRSSSTLMEDASLPVSAKSIKGKSQKQATRLPASEVVAEPVRRSTRCSSSLQEEKTSAISVGESVDGVEVVGKRRSRKQAKERGSKSGVPEISSPIAEAVAEPARRSTRHSSNLVEEGISLPVVGKSIKGGEAVRNSKSLKHAKDHGLTGGGPTDSLADNEVIVEPVRRSTHRSSSLLKNRTKPVVGKSIKEGKAVMKGKSWKQRKDHDLEGEVSLASLSDNEAIGEPAKRLTRGSSKMSEDESHSLAVGKVGGDDEAIRNKKSGKHKRDRSIEMGGSAASSRDSRAVITPTRRSTCGHSDEVRKDNSTKKSKAHIIEQGDSTTSLVDNEAVSMPGRRSTCRSSKIPADGEVRRSPCSPHLDKEAVTTPAKRSTRHSSAVPADSEVLKSSFSSHSDNEASITSTRRSTHHSLKLSADSEMKSPCSLRLNDEAVTMPARRSTRHSAKVSSESEVLKSSYSSLLDSEPSITPARRSTLHSSKVSSDSEVLRSSCFSHPDNQAAITPATRLTSHLSKGHAESEAPKSSCSLHPASSLLEDIKEDALVKVESLRKEQTYVQEGQVDIKRTFIEETDIAGQISVPGPLDTSLTEVSNDVNLETASQMRQSPESVPLEKIEHDTSLVGTLGDLDDVSLTSHIIEGSEAANNSRDESPLNIVEVSSEVQEEFSGKLGCSNVDATVDAGTLESYGDDRDATTAPAEPTSSTIDNKKACVCALDMDGLASMQSQNIISPPVHPTSSEKQPTAFHTEISTAAFLKVPDSTGEVDPNRDDIMTMHVTAPRSPCKSSDELSLTSDAKASHVFASKDLTSDLEIYGASEVGLQVNEATYISRPALVGKSSEELLPTSASPEIDPELKVEVECPREDFMAGSRVDKILVTSDTKVCSETYRDINIEESDSKEEVHNENKERMEGTEAANTACSPLSCKSAGVLSPTFLPTLHNEISLEIDVTEPDPSVHAQAMSKVASDIRVSLVETSGTHSKTLEVSMTAERDAGSLSNIQRSSEDEVENCKVDTDAILTAQLASEECDAGKKIEASIAGSESQSCIGVDVIKETWESSTLSVTVNAAAATEGDKSGAEKDGDELRPSSPSENPACDLDTGDHMKEGGFPSLTAQLAPEECAAGEKIEAFIAGSESQSCIGVDVIKGTWVSSTLPVTVNAATATEGDKSGAEKNGDELRPSSPSENPSCDLDTGDHMKEGGSPSSTAQLAPEECYAGEKIEAFIAGSESQSCIGVEVIKGTWVSSTLPVTVNAAAATEDDESGAEKNGVELRSSSPSENPSCDLDTGDHMKEGGSPSSTAQVAPEECDAGEKIEASIAGSESQSCIGVEVIKGTWVSSTLPVTVNAAAATESDKSGAEKNGDELRPSSPGENPACDLDTADNMREGGSPSSTAQLAPEECDAGEKIEASIAGSESQSCIGVEVIKGTWVSATLPVTVNDAAATEGDKSGAEKNGDELRSSSPSENPSCDLDTADHMREGGSPSSTVQLAPEECDTGKKIEASISGSESESCIGVEVIKETWVSSAMVNDAAATEGDKSGAEKNGDELRPSSPSENPAFDLDTCDHMKEGGSSTSTAQLAPEECDAGKKIEACIVGSELQSYIGVEIIKETWVSSTSSVTVNDDAETEGDASRAEKNGDELSPSSPSEHPVCDLDTGVHMKERGSPSSTDDTVNGASTLHSHDYPKKSDFTQSLSDKDQTDVEGNLRDSFDDKFCEDSSGDFRSLDTFIKPDGPSYVLPVASKNGESTPSQVDAASSKVIEGKTSIDHGSSIQTLAASGKLVEQLEKEDGLLVVNVESTEISASTTDNRSTDAVLFGGDTKAGDLPIFPVCVTCDEEILPITTCETPATWGYKGSVNKGDIQELPCVPDSEAARLLFDGKGVAQSVTESFGVDSVDPSPKVTFKEQEASEQLNVVANILPETVHTANELAGVEHESPALAAINAEEMENVESLESKASIKGEDDTVVKKADSIGQSTFDHFDELCEKQDDSLLLQSAEMHPGDVAAHSTLDNSASIMQGDERVSSLENFASATDMENASAEEETLNSQEFPCSVSTVLQADQKESPVSESGSGDAYNGNNDNDMMPEEDSNYNSVIASTKKAEAKHGSSHGINMFMTQDSRFAGLSENNDALHVGYHSLVEKPFDLSNREHLAKVVTASSGKAQTQDERSSKYRGTLECFERASNVEAPGVTLMFAEDLFCMDSEVANFVNDSAQVGQSGPHEENLGHGKCGDFSKINTTGSIVIEDGEMKAVVSSGSSDAKNEEACPYNCENSPKAENLPVSSSKPCAGVYAQDIHLADQSEDQGERRKSIQGSLEVSKFRKEEIFTVLEATKIEGSPTGVSKTEKIESTLIPTVAKQEEMIARNCTELSVTNVADQVVSWDCKESSAMERRPIGNELVEDPQLASVDTGDVGVNSAATHESIVSKDEIIARGECFEDFSEVNTAKSLAIKEGEMKVITLSGSSDAKSEVASPYDCQMPPKADNLSGGAAKHSAGLDSQAVYLVGQSEDKEERTYFQETSEFSGFRKEKTVTKIEGSPTVMFKSEKIEVALMQTVAKEGELIARNHTELSVTNVADQVSWNYGKSSVKERGPIENELEDPEFRGTCTAQNALASLDAGDVGVSSAATQESIVNKDETMAPEEYFEDFWSFPDTGDIDNSQHEAQVVDSQHAMESTLDKADHSPKSGNDACEEQNRSSDLKQTEDSNEHVQSTPMQLTRNFESYSVIDDAVRNKENTVGLKMGSTQKHNEKSAISTSSRRPLQSVLRTKSEH